MLLGVWVIILGSQLGVPGFWKEALAVVTGLVIIFIAYKLKPDGSSKPPVPKSYIEHHKEVPTTPSTTTPAISPTAQAALSVTPVNNPNQSTNS